jgi:hypothetical protein
MDAAQEKRWEELDPEARKKLDEQYLEELLDWDEPGLTEEGIRAYLEYRHERPGAQITTYEEGQIRHMLHRLAGPSRRPDPVEQEEHLDWLERFGAGWLHVTNAQTYVLVMMALTFAALIVLIVVLVF